MKEPDNNTNNVELKCPAAFAFWKLMSKTAKTRTKNKKTNQLKEAETNHSKND